MPYYYTNERNAQIVIALLKAHGIRKIIASPGTTNICLVSSMQRDSYFEMYSAPEERSAGYMACGLAAESGEPVVITCTGATASRNYLPAMTEAFYRKLPVLVITCSRRNYRIGHNIDQVTDRTQLPKDVAKISVQVPLVYDRESEWNDVIMVNKAILELNHRGCGPVHINLETNYSTDYSVKQLPNIRAIYRVEAKDEFPALVNGRVAIFVGSHLKWNNSLTEAVDFFCERHNSIVLCDHTSNYKGKYRVFANVMAQQTICKSLLLDDIDLLIHIGDVHAPGYSLKAKNVWRINPDGELRDTFGKLKYVFEMTEEEFFNHYLAGNEVNTSFYNTCIDELNVVKEGVKILVSMESKSF
ncbi:thiamine pyrophosphate-binding protein [Blautia sp. HCP3S3_C12]|uniref:thiamine pyrophosphate-binding protein n=1 Tax=unclassified Blautia TaxID=2648079 RepID=UPI003F8A15CB